MPPLAVRAVLALYPHAVRERYGAELAEMLADSPRPVRDLADVARCDLADRKEGLAVRRRRARDLAMVGLLVTPIASTVVYFAVLIAVTMLVYHVDPAGRIATAQGTANAIMAAPVALLAYWWGRRLRRTRLAAAAVVVPVALAGGVLLWPLIAPAHSFYAAIEGRGSDPEGLAGLLTAVSWCAGLVALVMVVTALRGRGRARLAIVAVVVGAFAVLDLSTVVHVLCVTGAQEAPRSSALLWYPAAISGYDFGLIRDADELNGAAGSMSVVLTVCTAFALALTGANRRREPAASPVAATG